MILTRIKQLILTLLIIYLGYITSIIIWQYYTPEQQQIPDENISAIIAAMQLPNGLFGIQAKKLPPKPTYTEVKETKLDITLIGILKKANPLAIIKFANNQVNIYGINDNIRGIATVKAIENNFVIINYNNQDEKLVIDRPIDQSILSRMVKNVQTPRVIPTTPQIPSPKPVEIMAEDKQTLKRYLKQAQVNPMSLLKVIRVEPFFINGMLDGFKVFPGTEVALFDSIGLKSGDVVTEINNVKLDNLASALQVGKDLAQETEFNISIERDGQLQNIYFNLN